MDHARITKQFYRWSTENTELYGACCTSTVKVRERHSTAEIIALAASSTENSVQASCRHIEGQVNQDAGIILGLFDSMYVLCIEVAIYCYQYAYIGYIIVIIIYIVVFVT